jgi:hypothetical protein
LPGSVKSSKANAQLTVISKPTSRRSMRAS